MYYCSCKANWITSSCPQKIYSRVVFTMLTQIHFPLLLPSVTEFQMRITGFRYGTHLLGTLESCVCKQKNLPWDQYSPRQAHKARTRNKPQLQEFHMEFHRSHLLFSPPSYSLLFLVAYRNDITTSKQDFYVFFHWRDWFRQHLPPWAFSKHFIKKSHRIILSTVQTGTTSGSEAKKLIRNVQQYTPVIWAGRKVLPVL